MAIHPDLPIGPIGVPPPATSIERVEAWTVSQAADVLAATSLASPSLRIARGTSVTLDIPLDEQALREEKPRPKAEAVHTVHKSKEPIRRDSVKRREALLKGKEGTRRRQRWENDRLLSNPYAEPPLPSDWQPQPTHTVQRVPYFLAPLWDAEYARKCRERERRAAAAKAPANKEEAIAAQVTSELRAKLKKSRGAKTLLQGLEEEVRGFVCQWDEKQKELESEGLIEPDTSDDEIVFVGRSGAMSDDKQREKEAKHLRKDKLIFQGLVDDHGAAFGRYLVHSIAAYAKPNNLARMCQLCAIKQITASHRWPKPVEAHKADLNLLVDTIHDEWGPYSQRKPALPDEPVPLELLNLLRLLADRIEFLGEERSTWWRSPGKRALRQQLGMGGEQRKLAGLHQVNNTAISDIGALSAKLGMFVKWSLGMDGGVWELLNGHKVASG